jgi:hypothetical protein
MGKWTGAVEHSMGGSKESKPPKEIHHVEVHHDSGKAGGHVIIHHHTHPEHHPAEAHSTHGDDEMTEHNLAAMGSPNPGEAPDPAAAQAGPPDPSGAGGAMPAPAAAAPAAVAGPPGGM